MSGRIGVDIIPHPQSREAVRKIDHLRRTGYTASHTQVQLLRGPAGVGKSVLVQRYAAQYPAQQTPQGWIRPVILATAGKGLTKPLAEALLVELNDSRPSRGTENDMMARAKQHLIAQKTELIIFDEVQDAMRGDPFEAADFFKRVVNWSICPVLLVGAPHSIELPKKNKYLRERSRPVIDLKGYNWFDASERKTYRSILLTLQGMLPPGIKSVDLHSDPVASKLNYATFGTMRRLTRLLDHAQTLAEESPKRMIDRSILEEAYEAFQNQESDTDPRRPNPFLQDQVLPKHWAPAC
jgi:DNA transposition AAA+ family ATPase